MAGKVFTRKIKKLSTGKGKRSSISMEVETAKGEWFYMDNVDTINYKIDHSMRISIPYSELKNVIIL